MHLLEIVVFISGNVVMILELVGSRILAPYVGTSTFVWTSLIGIILGSLSLGYYWGGRLADSFPTPKTLSLILFGSSISLVFTRLVSASILTAIQQTISDIRVGSVLATAILFAVPSVLLGMVTPCAVRLKIRDVEQSGLTVGRLYAFSTVGSISGTFLAGFYLISYFGSVKILSILSGTLFLTAILAYPKGLSELIVLSVIATPFLLGIRNVSFSQPTRRIIDVDTNYGRVLVYDVEPETQKKTRVMKIDGGTASAMFLEDGDLALSYSKYYLLAGYYKPNMRRLLHIGGGAYSVPKYFLNLYPNIEMDVVEIDPGVTALAREYFRLKDHPRMRIYHEDGRIYLNRPHEKYDVILVDAFKSRYSLPHHLTTRETVRRMYDLLEDDGLMIANIISAVKGPAGKFFRAEYLTWRSLFPEVLVFQVKDPGNDLMVQNLILVGLRMKENELKLPGASAEIRELLNHRWTGGVEKDVAILTDDYAPVEAYMLKTFLSER